MPSVATYKREDKAFVREQIFKDWTPSPLPSTAWLGIVEDGQYLVPDPQPTAAGDPAVYAAWDLVYDDLAGDFEDQRAPIRFGRLRVTGLIQKGAMGGYLDRLFEAVFNRLEDAPSDGPLGFTLQESKPVPLGNVGPWRLQMLEIPFGPG